MKKKAICFYFHVHQPYRLRDYSVFDVGNNHNYFDDKLNREICNKVAAKCYRPMNGLLLTMLEKYPEFKVSFSISGVVLDQFEQYNPEVLESFQQLVKTGRVEILSETYYHSLAFLYSKEEFYLQVDKHRKRVQELFGVTPTVFRNTELIFNNEVASTVEQMGYKGVIAEGVDSILGWRSPNYLYRVPSTENIKVMLKNYRLSDDIAFRFSNKHWADYPLTTSKFRHWIDIAEGDVVNLFMDYETFGEHQWEDSGIFEFMEQLPRELKKNQGVEFKTLSEAIRDYDVQAEIDVHHLTSWADVERDLSAWIGNEIQNASLKEVYMVEELIKRLARQQLGRPALQFENESESMPHQVDSLTLSPELASIVDDWRNLQTSDHFYYMCTKWFNDGDVHKYFSPYESPYEAFINFMNAMNDLIVRLNLLEKGGGKKLAS